MIAVSDSSPLITLSRVDCFDILPKIFGRICITSEVFHEVSINGKGLPGAAQVASAEWIDVVAVRDRAGLDLAISQTGLGAGEVSAVLLAKELSADLVIMDERKARLYAQKEGLMLIGCIGILEDLYERREVGDLRGIYGRLIEQRARVDVRMLAHSLAKFGLPRL